MNEPNKGLTLEEMKAKADFIRKDLVEVCVRNQAGHIAPSLSAVDYLTVLYYRVLRHNGDPLWSERDRVVFSKAHGAYGLYAILSDLGYVSREEWEKFYTFKDGKKLSRLAGCCEMDLEIGLEAGCGSLGHGLPMAVGMAFGYKAQKKTGRIYAVVGDGEMQEGSNWEALQFAAKMGLDNLTVIIDNNGLQAMDHLSNVLTVGDVTEDLHRKFEAFGCLTERCDGHDIAALTEQLERYAKGGIGRPQVMLAKCIKGYGLKAIENVAKFHFRIPTPEEIAFGTRYDQGQ
ncbi:MAG: transketolase [bacterium]|nr:transketolase [bacterium]